MKDKDIDREELADNEKEIDFIALGKRLWQRRKKIMIWCFVGAVLGIIVAYSIPKEYTTGVRLAPEDNEESGPAGGIGALAAMAGINMSASGSDAVYPNLYPEIVSSVPFTLSLLDVPLTDEDGERTFTLQEYMLHDTRAPWWSVITKAPMQLKGKFMSLFKTKKKDEGPDHKPDPFRLTEKEDLLIKAVNGAIDVSVDQKTYVVDIKVTMQDPVVSATLADTVVNRLREYVTQYRTNKARQDLAYIEKINEEAKQAYFTAQQKYADYLDTHQGIVMHSAQTMRDRLENEATLAFNLFNQTSQQLQMAKAKVQEQTPVYAIIKPASVPILPSAPRKVVILAVFVFLAFIACVGWILLVEPRQTPGDKQVGTRYIASADTK